MKKSDFQKYHIKHFTAAEVEKTGALVGDVKLELILALDSFRKIINRRVGLLVNGLTTGNHKAIWHALGQSADVFLYPDDNPINLQAALTGALNSGFKGVGIYYNGLQYSFHLDLRPYYAFWAGYKNRKKGVLNWEYYPLIADPANYE